MPSDKTGGQKGHAVTKGRKGTNRWGGPPMPYDDWPHDTWPSCWPDQPPYPPLTWKAWESSGRPLPPMPKMSLPGQAERIPFWLIALVISPFGIGIMLAENLHGAWEGFRGR